MFKLENDNVFLFVSATPLKSTLKKRNFYDTPPPYQKNLN